MARKRRQPNQTKNDSATLNLSDALNDDVLSQLKAAKKELAKIEQEEEKEKQEKLRQARKEREKNKSFEELLEEYGDMGTKY